MDSLSWLAVVVLHASSSSSREHAGEGGFSDFSPS